MHVNTIPCCLKKKLLPQDLPASSLNSHPKTVLGVEKPTDLGSPLSMDVFEVLFNKLRGITFYKYSYHV